MREVPHQEHHREDDPGSSPTTPTKNPAQRKGSHGRGPVPFSFFTLTVVSVFIFIYLMRLEAPEPRETDADGKQKLKMEAPCAAATQDGARRTPARACAHRKGSRAWKVSMARVRVHGSSSGARRYCEKMAVACSELDE